jgi:hypothetical protein
MLRRRGTYKEGADPDVIAAAFQKHLREVDAWLEGKSYVKYMRVPYREVLNDPKSVSQNLANFLDISLNVEVMCAQVDSSLYRNRAG